MLAVISFAVAVLVSHSKKWGKLTEYRFIRHQTNTRKYVNMRLEGEAFFYAFIAMCQKLS